MRRIAKCLGLLAVCTAVMCLTVAPVTVRAQSPGSPTPQAGAPAQQDSVRALVGRLDLEKYKATIKALTQFGDRMQGTDRNRAAIDWLEMQLRSFGYTNVQRHRFMSGSGRILAGMRLSSVPKASEVTMNFNTW